MWEVLSAKVLKATLMMIYKNKRMIWPSDWRILCPNDTKRNPATKKIFCLQESRHAIARNLSDYVPLEVFNFCKDEEEAKHFALIQWHSVVQTVFL